MYKFSDKSIAFQEQLAQFMEREIYSNEPAYEQQLNEATNRFAALPLMDELKEKAKAEGLWNLFVPPSHGEYTDFGGLSNFDYAPLAELMGRVSWSPEVFNCNAPDTGNMEVFMKYGSEAQKARWLTPLLAGEIRSSYAMTEPQVASSDATNVELEIRREGAQWTQVVYHGRHVRKNSDFYCDGQIRPEQPIAPSSTIPSVGAKGHARAQYYSASHDAGIRRCPLWACRVAV